MREEGEKHAREAEHKLWEALKAAKAAEAKETQEKHAKEEAQRQLQEAQKLAKHAEEKEHQEWHARKEAEHELWEVREAVKRAKAKQHEEEHTRKEAERKLREAEKAAKAADLCIIPPEMSLDAQLKNIFLVEKQRYWPCWRARVADNERSRDLDKVVQPRKFMSVGFWLGNGNNPWRALQGGSWTIPREAWPTFQGCLGNCRAVGNHIHESTCCKGAKCVPKPLELLDSRKDHWSLWSHQY